MKEKEGELKDNKTMCKLRYLKRLNANVKERKRERDREMEYVC